MYCINCGAELVKEAKFCGNCGRQTHHFENDSQGASTFVGTGNETVLVSKQSANNLENLLELFVGPNKREYYSRKWTKDHSWNWAAFFLTLFWLGYRKMYVPIIITVVLFLGIDILALLFELKYTDSIGIVTSVFFGFTGNMLYKEYANKKINKLKLQSDSYQILERNVVSSGGTSWNGVFITLGIFVLYIIINLNLTYIIPITNTIHFGHSVYQSEVINRSNTFSTNDEIFYEFYFSDYKGGDYTIVLEHVQSDNTRIYDSWDSETPPDWPGVYNSMNAPYDKGKYIMKIIKDNRVSAQGTFAIR